MMATTATMTSLHKGSERTGPATETATTHRIGGLRRHIVHDTKMPLPGSSATLMTGPHSILLHHENTKKAGNLHRITDVVRIPDLDGGDGVRLLEAALARGRAIEMTQGPGWKNTVTTPC